MEAKHYRRNKVRPPLLALLALVGCTEDTRAELPDGFTFERDAAMDAAVDAGAALDAQIDVQIQDSGPDVIDDGSCTSRSRWIHLLSFDNQLLRYQPSEDNAITRLGRVRCEGADANAHNMTVDRAGRVWVIDQGGRLFYVEPGDMSCTNTLFEMDQPEFEFLGATFVYDASYSSSMTPEERLVVSGGPTPRTEGGESWGDELAVIDTDTFAFNRLRRVGDTSALLVASSGDGDLWSIAWSGSEMTLFPTNPSNGETSPATGAFPVLDAFQSSVVFWGGRFYAFLADETGGGTDVYTYTPSTALWEFVVKLDERIVGSGVSTCAPVMLI